jgi:uncharacterized membrane protein
LGRLAPSRAPARRRAALRPAAARRDPAAAPPAGRGAEPDGAARAFPFAPIAALAAAGFAETAYLAFAKLTDAAVACPLAGGGCASVLASDYATLLGGVPLSAAGAAVYGGVAAAAAAGARAAARGGAPAAAPLRAGVLAGGVLLATSSAYLMYVLATAFPGELCPWCLGSAALSAGIAALGLHALPRRELEVGAMPGAGLAAATLLALSLAAGAPESLQAGTGVTQLEYKQPVVTTQGPPRAAALAARLRDAGAQMYGAFWCSHCYDQKQAFGRDAMEAFPYVECFPGGWKAGVEMAPACKAAGLVGFPTWVVGGEKLEGEQTLETLEAALARGAGAAPAS